MKKLKLLTAITITALLLIFPFTSVFTAVASAEDIGTDISTILNYFGYEMTPAGMQRLLDDLQNGGIGSIVNLLGFDVNDIIGELQEYIENSEAESTTEQATEIPSEDTPSTDALPTVSPTKETTTTKTVSSPSYSNQKPAKNNKGENTTVPVTEEDTAEISSEEYSSDEITTTEVSTNKPSDDFSKTVFIVFLTMTVFIVGIATGVIITKKLSSAKKNGN